MIITGKTASSFAAAATLLSMLTACEPPPPPKQPVVWQWQPGDAIPVGSTCDVVTGVGTDNATLIDTEAYPAQRDPAPLAPGQTRWCSQAAPADPAGGTGGYSFNTFNFKTNPPTGVSYCVKYTGSDTTCVPFEPPAGS